MSDLFKQYKYRSNKAKSTNQSTKNNLNSAYDLWVEKPSDENFKSIIDQARPVINTGMNSYGSNNKSLYPKAKKITANAIRSYKPESNTNIRNWILLNLQGLQRYSEQSVPFRTPERVRLEAYHLQKLENDYRDSHGVDPDDDYLQEQLGISNKRLNYIRTANKPVVAESQLESDDSSDDSYDVPVSDFDWQQTWIEIVRQDLDPINKKILDMRLGRGKYKKELPVSQIAKELGISAAAVSQRSNKIANMLAKGYEMEGKY